MHLASEAMLYPSEPRGLGTLYIHQGRGFSTARPGLFQLHDVAPVFFIRRSRTTWLLSRFRSRRYGETTIGVQNRAEPGRDNTATGRQVAQANRPNGISRRRVSQSLLSAACPTATSPCPVFHGV